jgi:hypothetical protein
LGHVIYFVTILGGGFGINNEPFALTFGSISLALVGLFFLRAVKTQFCSIDSRVAFLLTAVPLLWTAAFSVGRERYGVAWAFSDFHASPMLVPFYIGMAIFALAWIDSGSNNPRRIAGGSIIAFALLPVFTAIPFGHWRSNEMRIFSLMGSAANCNNGTFSRYLLEHLNGLQGHDDLYDLTVKNNPQLCAAQPQSTLWLPLLQAPELFGQLMGTDRETRAALSVLWDVYLTHLDLRKAFALSDAQLGKALIDFAASDARGGSQYESQTLAPYPDNYIKLQQRISLGRPG